MDENRRLSDKFALRMPDGMRGKLRGAAEENNRSINQEIVERLQKSFEVDRTAEAAQGNVSMLSLEQELETLRAQIRAEAMARASIEGRLRPLEEFVSATSSVEAHDSETGEALRLLRYTPPVP